MFCVKDFIAYNLLMHEMNIEMCEDHYATNKRKEVYI